MPTETNPTTPSRFAMEAAKAISKQQSDHPERSLNTVEERAELIDASFKPLRELLEAAKFFKSLSSGAKNYGVADMEKHLSALERAQAIEK